jgi:hypothetical protein
MIIAINLEFLNELDVTDFSLNFDPTFQMAIVISVSLIYKKYL